MKIQYFPTTFAGLVLTLFSTFPQFTSAQIDPAEPGGIKLPAKSKFQLYLLAGQSNMAGRGKVTDDDRKPIPRIYMLNKQGKWQPAVDPIHFDKPAAGVGLGRSFATEMLKNLPDDVAIGLIPAAAGGSAIESWSPGGFHDQTKSHPYDDALHRTRLALKDGTLMGILWHQGESDCTPENSGLYETRLHELINRFRHELSAPHLPFIAGQMGQFPERPWSEFKKKVDQVHQNLPRQVSHTGFVNSDGLTHTGDQIHFDSKSLKEFGTRYAQALKVLQRENTTPQQVRDKAQ